MPQKEQSTLCTLCKLLPLSQSHSRRHESMSVACPTSIKIGEAKKTLYQCSGCKTLWLYEQDKWGACLGFKLWPGKLQDFQRSSQEEWV